MARRVKTAAGAKRYKLPIGTPIPAGRRNADALTFAAAGRAALPGASRIGLADLRGVAQRRSAPRTHSALAVEAKAGRDVRGHVGRLTDAELEAAYQEKRRGIPLPRPGEPLHQSAYAEVGNALSAERKRRRAVARGRGPT